MAELLRPPIVTESLVRLCPFRKRVDYVYKASILQNYRQSGYFFTTVTELPDTGFGPIDYTEESFLECVEGECGAFRKGKCKLL